MTVAKPGSEKLKGRKKEAYARKRALDDVGLSDAYRATRDCSKMQTSTINSNAKKIERETPVRLRIAYLREHGLDEKDRVGRPTDFRAEFPAKRRSRLSISHASWRSSSSRPRHQRRPIASTARGRGRMKKLTPREAAFVEAWLESKSVSQAYTTAYRSKMKGEGLRANGNKVAHRPHVRAAYDVRKAALDAKARKVAEQRHGVTIDRIMREYAKLAFSNIFNCLTTDDNGGVYLDLNKATRDDTAAIAQLSCEVVMTSAAAAVKAAGLKPAAKGKRKVQVPVLRFAIRLHDKLGALVAMGKHLGMFELDHRQRAEAAALAAERMREARYGDDLGRRLAILLTNASATDPQP